MNPYRIVRSEAELDAVAIDSLVCPAYYLSAIHEKSAPNEWVEPGSEDTLPTAAVWEVMTGSYETLVMDEDREAWVLIDAAAPKLVRPPRPATSPDYATRVQNRAAEFVTHQTLDEARQAIEDAVGDGVTIGHTNIWKRPKDAYDYRSHVHIPAGTAVSQFPWNSPAAATI
ncbi:hypothetical protein [Arthrobacter sp. UYCo732]|uniref:hypothetical protein n=1 Tax=Arthrobacter sp. UYCo732 TaxID=3156336 RepID=UPI00339318F7